MSNVTVQEALNEAIEMITILCNGSLDPTGGAYKTVNQCKAAIAEIEKCESETSSQPVGRIVQFPKFDGNLYKRADITWNKVNDQDLLYTSPQPIEKCEPVGWYCKACKETGLSHCSDPENCGGMVRTYTSPISKEWVVIDEKTIDDIGNTLSDEQGFIPVETWTEFARAIEAKLKQLNVLEKG